MASIELDGVNVVFPVVHDKGITLKEFVTRHLYRRKIHRIESVHALRDIDLHMGDGHRLGIIGHNGAGKSTLLRTIAGVYPIDSGRRHVDGRICSLFDITLGFERESTGWENIKYRGYLQGETPKSLKRKMDEIAEFSELGHFLDLPIKCYSAGMVMRLAFAIATSNEPEILLIDEVFGTGDLAFREKAKKRMDRMMETARVIVMVGHELSAIASFCETVAWMEQGRIRDVGPAEDVINEYELAAYSKRSAELLARYSGPGETNTYMGRMISEDGDTMAQIYKNLKGRWYPLASTVVTETHGRLQFDVVGSTLRLFLNDRLVCECVDGDLCGGSVGIRAHRKGSSFRNFEARTMDSSSSPSVPMKPRPKEDLWVLQSGEFLKDQDSWVAEHPVISVDTLGDVNWRDVSVSCDIDILPRARRAKAA